MDTINFIPMPISTSDNGYNPTLKEWIIILLSCIGILWFACTIAVWLSGDGTLVQELRDQWEFIRKIPGRIW